MKFKLIHMHVFFIVVMRLQPPSFVVMALPACSEWDPALETLIPWRYSWRLQTAALTSVQIIDAVTCPARVNEMGASLQPLADIM